MLGDTFVKGADTVILPPGIYIIGDPCYSVPDGQWNRVLEESAFFVDQCFATFDREDGQGLGVVVAFYTAVGDGEYRDGAGRKYPVDAGLIGIIPAGDAVQGTGTQLIEFKNHVQCSAFNGVIEFGNVIIDTRGEEDDDDAYGDDLDWDDE